MTHTEYMMVVAVVEDDEDDEPVKTSSSTRYNKPFTSHEACRHSLA